MQIKFEPCLVQGTQSAPRFTINPRDDGFAVFIVEHAGTRMVMVGTPPEFEQIGTTMIRNAAVAAFVGASKKVGSVVSSAGVAGGGGNGNGNGAPKSDLG